MERIRIYVEYMVGMIGRTATRIQQTLKIEEETETMTAAVHQEDTSITILVGIDATVPQDLPLHVQVRHPHDVETAEVTHTNQT